MKMEMCFPREFQDAQKRNLPLVMVGGTVEYHGPHCSYGCDSLIAEGLVDLLSKEKEMIVAPTVHYSPSSYAVGDETSGTVHIEENAFENYLYYIFYSYLASGFRNIYVVIHHQFEQESLMPMTLSYMKAAKRATMQYLEKTKGQGWWGSESYASYYEELEGDSNPFAWIKVIPSMSAAVQTEVGYDHAGEFESSMLMALYPEAVDLSRIDEKYHWFTQSARKATPEHGKKMVELSLDYLRKAIQ